MLSSVGNFVEFRRQAIAENFGVVCAGRAGRGLRGTANMNGNRENEGIGIRVETRGCAAMTGWSVPNFSYFALWQAWVKLYDDSHSATTF
jgi:hypothetical protein